MAQDKSNSDTPNSTLLRGLAIMDAVANSSRPLSIADLVIELGLAKPTVHRIASQLEEESYLQRNPSDKRFVIGNKLKEFSTNILSNSSIGAPRRAILEALSNETGETCNCTMLDGYHTVYFDRVECNWPIKINLHPGSRLPLHATASGKLFLAYMKKGDRNRILNAAPLKASTEHTLTSEEELKEQLKSIKKQGIAFDNEEFIDGMVAIAVPVFDSKNRICFTLAVHAPTSRQTIESLSTYIPSLHHAADALAESYCSKKAD
ncbi:MAG: IclR family transcriptional regulator [Cocleimonas sp.]